MRLSSRLPVQRLLEAAAKTGEFSEKIGVRNPKEGNCLWKKYGGVNGGHSVSVVAIGSGGALRSTGREFALTPDETMFLKAVAAVLGTR